jgi:uncharacterized membrane protein YdbT with pleckstrin-like domain
MASRYSSEGYDLVASTQKIINDTLVPGEDIIRHLRPHWIILVLPTLRGLGITAIYVLLLQVANTITGNTPGPLGIFLFIVYAAALSKWSLNGWVAWLTTHYLFTTERIVTRSGWLRISGETIALNRIHSIQFEKTLLERMIGSGSLKIESAAANDIVIRHVTDVEAVQREMYEQIQREGDPDYRRQEYRAVENATDTVPYRDATPLKLRPTTPPVSDASHFVHDDDHSHADDEGPVDFNAPNH